MGIVTNQNLQLLKVNIVYTNTMAVAKFFRYKKYLISFK